MEPSARGVVYVAWGAAHVDVARRSAATVKRHNPDLATAIWCKAGDATHGFDHAFTIPAGLRRPKVNVLADTPFERTLFLDNDTAVRADLADLFAVLDGYDMAGAQVVLWHRPRHRKPIALALPDAFPETNTGVLLYRRNETTRAFFAAWAARFAQSDMGIDQPAFREALWEARDLRFHTLPPQFNKRVFEASELIWSDQPRPRILHLELFRPTANRLKAWIANRIRQR